MKALRWISAALLLVGSATAAEAKKSDYGTWHLDVHFVVGVESYSGSDKTDLDAWIGSQVAHAEALYGDKPALDIHETIERQTRAGGRTLARMEFETSGEYSKFMDGNFDHMAKTKTEGWFTVLIVNDICIGWDTDKNGNKERYCIGGRAKFPHWVTPFDRKHGIILNYPDSRDHLFSHELGHVLALKHTFEAYTNINPSLNCNTDYRPAGDGGHCASCTGGADMAADTCTGSANVMDYCDSDNRVYLNSCQEDRAAGQREKYMTTGGETNYFKIKGLLGEPICKQDGDCANGEYCDTGTITIGRNQCVPAKADGDGCMRATQCAGGACNVRCYTPDSKTFGQSCNLTGECKRGKCSATGWGVVPGMCVCTENSHCADGKYCNKGVADIGTNVCKDKLADGALCTKDHMCAGGGCNVRCYTPDSKSFGQSCNLTDECKRGKCSATGWGVVPGKCVCTENSHCADGKYCNKGVGGIGTNVCKDKLADGALCTKNHICAGGACNVRCYTPDSKHLGQSCNLDGECSDGTCSAAGWGVAPGKCVCTEDSHCADGKYCNEGVAGIGTNVCKDKLADGAVCTKAHMCAGGACNVRCYTPDSKSIGDACNLNAECKKGKCSGTGWGVVPGKCVCEKDSDCASGKYCNTGVAGIGTNVCKNKLANGKACTKAKQCDSNCCKVYNFKLQCRPTNKCN